MAQFTRRAIMESFIRLVATKPLDKITVRDIVEDCEITRNTFYYHFQDIYDLTAAVFRSEFSAIIRRRAAQHADGGWADPLRDVIDFVAENRSAVLHIYHSNRREELMRAFDKGIDDYLRQAAQRSPYAAAAGEQDVEMVVRALRCILAGYARDWLNAGMKELPPDFTERFDALFGSLLEDSLRRSAQRQGG